MGATAAVEEAAICGEACSDDGTTRFDVRPDETPGHVYWMEVSLIVCYGSLKGKFTKWIFSRPVFRDPVDIFVDIEKSDCRSDATTWGIVSSARLR